MEFKQPLSVAEMQFIDHSNRIEGEYSKEAFEEAVEAWEFVVQQKEMSLSVILQTHDILMQSRPLEDKYKGVFRDCPVYIGGKEALYHSLIVPGLREWCQDMNDNAGPDEEHSKWLHVKYEEIHPFADGNGRTGRIFMNWWRLRNQLPVLVIHQGQEQMEYYKWFK
jgi:Fic family protein